MNKCEVLYFKQKEKLANSTTICEENKKLFLKFFEMHEQKLKRINGISRLDEATYKTLLSYASRFRTVNRWFNNKPWVNLTKEDIEQVYNDLEDGKILTIGRTTAEGLVVPGTPVKDKINYYNKVFKSLPFRLAGKDQISKEVIQLGTNRIVAEVRFIREEEIRKIADACIQPKHKCLVWLAFDIGENINTLLNLRMDNIRRSSNEDTGEPEYTISLYGTHMKRSRVQRSEITNYVETTTLLDEITEGKRLSDSLFDFEHRQAMKFLDRATKKRNITCEPNNQKVTWKDLRSSMACDLLEKDWSTDEVKARLGHSPSSTMIDKYCNYLAVGRHKTKKKVYDYNINKLREELEQQKQRERIQQRRNEDMQQQMADLQKAMMLVSAGRS